MNLKVNAVKELHKVTGLSIQQIDKLLETPPDSKMGDLAFPCFSLAKNFGKSPIEVARLVRDRLVVPKGFKKVEFTGPYLNFFYEATNLAEQVLKESLKKDFAKSKKYAGEKIIIDMIATNPNKPAHIGHARNSCLADSLSKCMLNIGYNVVRQTYGNDLGIPTTAVFWATKNLKNLPKKTMREDFWQGEIYAKMQELMEKDPKIKAKVSDLLSNLEKDRHSKLAKAQRAFAGKCTLAQDKTWNRLNVDYDLVLNESDIVTSGMVEEAVKLLQTKGYLVEGHGINAGCLVFPLSEFKEFSGMKNPDKILFRPNGAATYTGKDIALTLWKAGKLKADFKYKELRKGLYETSIDGKVIKNKFSKANKMMWVVASEQDYVILVDRYALKVICGEQAFADSHHFSYAMIGFGGDAKISSRSGANDLAADVIIDKAKVLIKKEIVKRNPKLPITKVKLLSESIASGAIRYYLIKVAPNKGIDFSFKDALSFEGNTGPYLQYALVRASKILKKSKQKVSVSIDFSLLASNEEQALIKHISKFPKIVESAAENYAPHLVANFAYELAQKFSTFYSKHRVIGVPLKEEKARLLLVTSFYETLKKSLNLLGIKEVEVM
ncbi:arginine--tRNA ligase [Candidatus Woesearchaeota archaeon]|nr:arginine--tRNA ligase [Candidatus Woesearchaeota archaeon]MBT4248503.1 arginine--tRNA ligase [Candidatus Woesearchaeota archaeon]